MNFHKIRPLDAERSFRSRRCSGFGSGFPVLRLFVVCEIVIHYYYSLDVVTVMPMALVMSLISTPCNGFTVSSKTVSTEV